MDSSAEVRDGGRPARRHGRSAVVGLAACLVAWCAGASPAAAQPRYILERALDPLPTLERWEQDERATDLELDNLDPDIREPGPDLGDFPNSAATLPKGRSYVEFAPLTLVASGHGMPGSYSSPFLLRYGVTNDVEFRLLGSGVASVFNDGPSGFAPLLFDLKIHLWDEDRDHWMPASSLEVWIQTDWASRSLQAGIQPAINLNFDLELKERVNLEWTLGYLGVQERVPVVIGQRYDPNLNANQPVIREENLSAYQFTAQWAVEYEINERWKMFAHGYFNGAVLLQSYPGTVVGLGGFYTWSERLMLFGSCNAGLDSGAPPLSAQWGLALAF